MKLLRIICIIKTIYRTLSSKWFFDGVAIDGCELLEQDDKTLKCEICGRVTN